MALAATVPDGVDTEAYLECFGAISELLASLGMVSLFLSPAPLLSLSRGTRAQRRCWITLRTQSVWKGKGPKR